MNIDFQEILKELEYRLPHGIINLNEEHQVTMLVQILRENGVDDANELAQRARVVFGYVNEASKTATQKKKPAAKPTKQVGTKFKAFSKEGEKAVYFSTKNKMDAAIKKGSHISVDQKKKNDSDKEKRKTTNQSKKQEPKPATINVSAAEKRKKEAEKSKESSVADRADVSTMSQNDVKKYVDNRIAKATNEFNTSENSDKYATDFLKIRSAEINDNYLRPQGTEGSSLAENNGGKYINTVFNKGGNITEKEEKEILNEITNTPLAKTMPINQRNEWARIALETAKTEAKVLLTEKKYRAAKKQKQPYPLGVIMDKQSRSMLVNLFESKVKKDSKNKKHYEKQLRFVNELEESDTGILYELEDGTVGFKHTSNKKTYSDPHNNTSVDEKIKGMNGILAKNGKKVSPALQKAFDDTSLMVKKASEGLEASCKDFYKERKKLKPDAEKAQIEILTKVLTNYPLKLGKRKNYLNDFMGGDPPRKWVQKAADDLKIKLPAKDQDVVRIAIHAAAQDNPPTDAVICVKKISEMVENINDTNIKKMSEKFGINEKEMKLALQTTTSIKDAASGRREVMKEAHTKMVKSIQEEDLKENPKAYPANEDADNGTYQQAYVRDYLHRMHFDAYIGGERDGVSSQNINGDNVEPSYYRECLAELSGYTGKIENQSGRDGLVEHLTKRLRVYSDSDSVAFGNGKSSKEIGKEVYRTKGEAKSILGGLGKDLQTCLKGKASTK